MNRRSAMSKSALNLAARVRAIAAVATACVTLATTAAAVEATTAGDAVRGQYLA